MKTVSLPTYNQAMNQFTGTLITIAGWGKYSDGKCEQINQKKTMSRAMFLIVDKIEYNGIRFLI